MNIQVLILLVCNCVEINISSDNDLFNRYFGDNYTSSDNYTWENNENNSYIKYMEMESSYRWIFVNEDNKIDFYSDKLDTFINVYDVTKWIDPITEEEYNII